MPRTDYLIIGAGIVGLSTAYHLKLEDPDASILVVDKAPGPGGGDTSKSAAAFRVFFTNRINFSLAHASVSFYRDVQMGGWDLQMRWVGYLFVADDRMMERLKPGLSWADKHGLNYEVLEPGVLEERLGLRVNVEGLEEAELMGAHNVVGGVLVRDAGVLMPDRLVSYYYEWLRSHNVSFAFNSRVRGFILKPRRPLGIEGEPFPWQDTRVEGVELDDGTIIEAGKKTIVATGAWTPYLLNPIGVDSYSRPKKRQIFTVKADTPEKRRALYAKGFNREGVSPMIILPNGAYMRPAPEEEAYWTGYSDELGRPFQLEEPPVPEERFYTYTLHPMISLYMPAFEGSTPASSWAGHYDLSFDGMPVIFEAFDSDLIVSAGTSGSGILKGDAIGSVTAAVALERDTVTLYTGETLKTEWLGLTGRLMEKEYLII
ncbi:MAG: FAD-binding oxidoreductase [Desulfurococcales archaeon]|nr:FAD-binding oxidoreductase [Desulfurococcales archaeon]